MTTLLSNLSVRLKLAIVAVLMLGITAGLLGFAFLTTQRVERMAEEFAVELTPRAVFALEAAGSAFAASTEEKNAILASNIDSVRRRGEAYRDAMQRALGRMDELRGLIHAEHEGLLQTARTAAADYQAVVQRILTLAETQQDEAATELSLGAAREARLRMSDARCAAWRMRRGRSCAANSPRPRRRPGWPSATCCSPPSSGSAW
ncbi:hypothetical protein ACFFMP_13400 [Pseudoroseomonas cervicalis]|uniref:hypothetical protein n=1 Tax=Teichococcus cervicalis TaxID=204525 RepID=UPI0035EEABB6